MTSSFLFRRLSHLAGMFYRPFVMDQRLIFKFYSPKRSINLPYFHFSLPEKNITVVSSRHMAGHSKWQNVKHVKAAKDKQKNILCSRYARLVSLAVREKGPDPKSNIKLANLLEEAKKNSVPSATLENAMKRANNRKLQEGTAEVLGPGGCYIIVDYETDNVSDIRHMIKVLCKRYSANLLSGDGRWRGFYEKKGFLKAVNQINGQPLDAEKALDAAIVAGAEEVQKRGDENEKCFLEFICAPEDLHPVKKELEKLYEIEEAYVGYVPTNLVQLSENDMVSADKLLNELGDLEDVIRIHENVQ